MFPYSSFARQWQQRYDEKESDNFSIEGERIRQTRNENEKHQGSTQGGKLMSLERLKPAPKEKAESEEAECAEVHPHLNPVVMVMGGSEVLGQILVHAAPVGHHCFFKIAFRYSRSMTEQRLFCNSMQANVPDGKPVAHACIIFPCRDSSISF